MEPAIVYIGITSIGYLLVLSGGTSLSRIIRNSLKNKDIFNKENETFPQEERLLENEYSINLPARYRLKIKYETVGSISSTLSVGSWCWEHQVQENHTS
jgi:hypothetical protein